MRRFPNNYITWRIGFCLVAVAMVLAGVAADVSASDPVLAQPKTMRVGYQPGTQDLVMTYMLDQGFHKRYNLNLDVVTMLSPSALHTAIVEKQVDMGFGGFVTMAVARHQGRDIIVFGVLTGPSNVIVVRKDSPVQSVADLRGRRLGVFGGLNATTTQITLGVGRRVHGIDLRSEAELITAPNPALFGLLDRGDLDAALFGTTESIRALLDDRYRVISDISDDWASVFGRPPAHVTMATTESYAAGNEDALIAFMAAYRDTLEYIQNTPEVWEDYAARIELHDPRAPQLLQERVGSRFLSVLDEAQARAQIELLETLIEIIGPDELFPEVPDGLLRLDLQP